MGKQKNKVNPERQRTRFTKEFKLEAVRLLELGQKPATQLALELGIQRNQLYKWQEQLQKAGAASAFRGPGRKPLDEQSESRTPEARAQKGDRGARHPKKSGGVLREGCVVKYAFIGAQRRRHSLSRCVGCSGSRAAASTPGRSAPRAPGIGRMHCW